MSRLSLLLVCALCAGLCFDARSNQGDALGWVSHTRHPLVARYSLDLSPGAQVRVEFGPDTKYGRTTSWFPGTGKSTGILVAGMRPSTGYHMRAVAKRADGTVWHDADHVFRTGSPPPGRSPVLKATRLGGPLAPGVEMLNLVAIEKKNLALNSVVTDLEGNLIWYYDHGTTAIPAPMRPLDSGHMLVTLVKYLTPNPDAVLREVDLEGNTVRQMTNGELNARLEAAGFALQAYEMHHEALPLSNGHVLILVDLHSSVKGVPVLGDAVVDLDADWRPVWVWNGFDHLDPRYHPWGLEDWTHANAIVVDPTDGNLLISFRHLSWIVKIDYRDGRGTGRVLWRLGYKGDFRLANGNSAEWFFGQHVPVLLDNPAPGHWNMAVFDNGNKRPPDPRGLTRASRVVKLRYDENKKTAQVTWSLNLPWFSDAAGGVCPLPEGHFEYTAGWLALGGHVGELDENGREIWSMESKGQKIYRAWRIPSLYPGVSW